MKFITCYKFLSDCHGKSINVKYIHIRNYEADKCVLYFITGRCGCVKIKKCSCISRQYSFSSQSFEKHGDAVITHEKSSVEDTRIISSKWRTSKVGNYPHFITSIVFKITRTNILLPRHFFVFHFSVISII